MNPESHESLTLTDLRKENQEDRRQAVPAACNQVEQRRCWGGVCKVTWKPVRSNPGTKVQN